MTKFTREELQSWRCREGYHDKAAEAPDGTKRCAYCHFPLTANTATKDVQARLGAIFKPKG